MTKKRAAALLIVLIAGLAATGCESMERADGSPSAEDGTAAPDEKTGGPSSARFAGVFPREPQIAIEWQNTVVDVEPTSRFREPQGGPDTAHFETTLGLEEEPDAETQEFFKDLDDVETEVDGRLVRMTYTMDVEEIEENRYRFEFDAPLEFAELDKNDDLSVVVLLPRDAEDYGEAPTYNVQLDDEFVENAPDSFVITEADDAPGNRITVGVYERTDPKIPPIFSYLPL